MMLSKQGFTPDHKVCILGLGYVGLTLAATMADLGFQVLGVETRDSVLEQLNRGEAHFYEPGLKEKLQRTLKEGHLSFCKSLPPQCDATVFIVTVGTPLGDNGKPRMDMVDAASHDIARVLKSGDLVIMRSTVKVGTTRNVVWPILQQSVSDFDIAFCPERTLEGKALLELRELPQVIGGLTPEATLRATALFQAITPTVVPVSDPETAEMIKLVDNTQRDVWFAYSNEVARVCDAFGISAGEVITAGNKAYCRTGLAMPGPVGGPCLEKDGYILAASLSGLGILPEMTLAARKVNERQPYESVKALSDVVTKLKKFPSSPQITLMGLAFKGRPVTDDLRGTMAIPILKELRAQFPTGLFRGFDSLVSAHHIEDLGLQPCATLRDAFSGSHLVLILNNHPDFAAMPLDQLSSEMARPGMVYDFWNTFNVDELRLSNGIGYMTIGSHGRALMPGRGA